MDLLYNKFTKRLTYSENVHTSLKVDPAEY